MIDVVLLNLVTCNAQFKCHVQHNTQYNSRIDNRYVGPPDMMFGLTKGGKLRNVITHNVIWAN